jgi:DNA end-binding protein Ku
VPGKKAEKGYVLLREILARTDRIGIGRVVIRTRQYLAALMPLGDALILNLMRFPQELIKPDEFRPPAGNAKSYRVAPREMEMASQLVESMTAPWKPEQYKDEFHGRLRKLIDETTAKRRGKKTRVPSEPEAATVEETTNVVDFMALLKRSLEKKGTASAQTSRKSARRKPPTRRRAVRKVS